MDQQIRFTQTADGVNIAYATVGQGLPPVTYTIGSLSDKLGRRYFLIVGYGLAAVVALLLSVA